MPLKLFIGLWFDYVLNREGDRGYPRRKDDDSSSSDSSNDDTPMYQRPEDRFRDKLKRMEGTPDEVLQNEDLMAVLGPTLRADFQLIHEYEYLENKELDVPITVFGGIKTKHQKIARLEGWKQRTSKEFVLTMVPGDK